MCGITGALDLKGVRTFPSERLQMMSRAIAHRGPDDEGCHIEPGLAMGARRLSIIDLEGGRQPIDNETGEIWVAFNGVLFDYPDIRKDLLSRGHRLKTHCDTEAWVHLYEDFGERAFEKTKGQFAVSLWDRRNRTLILARDRMGICPLYYTVQDGWLLWGSEVKALLASGLVAARPDRKGIDYLFNFFCASTTRTFFEGVHSIPPGHYLRVKEGSPVLVKYWDLDFPDLGEERNTDDPSKLTEELDALIRQAIRRRLRADVPVVSYLSGGLDSSTVLGLSIQESGRKIPSFTIGFDRAGPDESLQAEETAALIGSPLTVVRMNRRDIAVAYPELIEAVEGPVIDTSCACLMNLAKKVHEDGYKVAITGEGGDELFGGYLWYKTQKIRQSLERVTGGMAQRFAYGFVRTSIGGGRSHWPPANGMAGVRTAQQDVYELVAQARETLYSGEMWDALRDHSAYADINLTNDRIVRWHPLNQSLYAGYKIQLSGLLMKAKGDHVALHSSVETRYPLLDEDVIEFCTRLDPKYKLHGLTDKWLLRKVATRSLPKPIANRPKTMFRATRSPTFLGPDRPSWVDQLLSEESLRTTGYFDLRGVALARKLQGRFFANPIRRFFLDMGLMGVISTQLWHHIYLGGGLCDLPTQMNS